MNLRASKHTTISVVAAVLTAVALGATAGPASAATPAAKKPSVASVTKTVTNYAKKKASSNTIAATCYWTRALGAKAVARNWAKSGGTNGAGGTTSYTDIASNSSVRNLYKKLNYDDRMQVGLNYLEWLC